MFGTTESYLACVSSVSSSQRNMSCLSTIGLYFAAKLGDTKELEDFIADLDRTLASKYVFISSLHLTCYLLKVY